MRANSNKAAGFTLIEVMVVVTMISVIAGITYPSYQSYVVQRAERQVQAQMLSLALELEQWRARNLSYLEFVPQAGYDNANLGTLLVPNNVSPSYLIHIGVLEANPAASVRSLSDPQANPNQWVMQARPLNMPNARMFRLQSNGLRCQTKDQEVSLLTPNCGDLATLYW